MNENLEQCFSQAEQIKKLTHHKEGGRLAGPPAVNISKKGLINFTVKITEVLEECGLSLKGGQIFANIAVNSDYLLIKFAAQTMTSDSIPVKQDLHRSQRGLRCNSTSLPKRLNKEFKAGNNSITLKLRRHMTGPPTILMFRLP